MSPLPAPSPAPSTDAGAADPVLGPWLKGFPPAAAPVTASQIGRHGWNVLRGDLPFPLALLRRDAVGHNIAWMQDFARERGVDLAPHGKTTMSPQLFRRQLDAGAWGITVASVFQLRLAVSAGARRVIIANQVLAAPDLDGLAAMLTQTPDLRVVFLVDSVAQLRLVEAWHRGQARPPVFEVLLEVGVPGGRTGVRGADDALVVARALHASPAVRLVGLECYEGLGVSGDSSADRASATALMDRVEALALVCDAEGLIETDEVIVSAGGSAIFDLVAGRLKPALTRPVRGLLRSGCYVTHDHGHYRRLVQQVVERCGCAEGLRPALEVWAAVQSTPEPGLALLTAGRRDLSFDIEMPMPVAVAREGRLLPLPAGALGRIKGLNDQHAHWVPTADGAWTPRVGDLVALGISHPCTTFDKWHWMPEVDEAYDVVGAVTTQF